MKRPPCTDKAANEYMDQLERQVQSNLLRISIMEKEKGYAQTVTIFGRSVDDFILRYLMLEDFHEGAHTLIMVGEAYIIMMEEPDFDIRIKRVGKLSGEELNQFVMAWAEKKMAAKAAASD